QIELVVLAVDAEPAYPMLALWNLCLVVVTGICDGNLLCHNKPPFPGNQYILTATIWRNDTQVRRCGGRVSGPPRPAAPAGRHLAPGPGAASLLSGHPPRW